MKSATQRRNRPVKLAVAATLVLAAVGATAGCAGQSGSNTALAPTSSDPSPSTSTSTNTATAPSTLAATSASAVPTTSRDAAVAIEDCGQGAPLRRPASLVLACADQGLQIKHLTWSNWSATGATATGTLTWHVCTPNCAESTQWDNTTAQITLADPVSETGDQLLFTKLELHVTGPTPAGFTRVATYDMAPS